MVKHSDKVGIDGHDHIQVKTDQDEDYTTSNNRVWFKGFPLEVLVWSWDRFLGYDNFPGVQNRTDPTKWGEYSHANEILPNEGKICWKYSH